MIIPDMDFSPSRIRIPDPGGPKSTKSRIQIRNTGLFLAFFDFLLLGISLFLPFLLTLSSIFNLYVSLSSPVSTTAKSLCPVCPCPLYLMTCRLVSHSSILSPFSLPYLLLSLLHLSPCPAFCHPFFSLVIYLLVLSLCPLHLPVPPPLDMLNNNN
jgi:hypothetical protein